VRRTAEFIRDGTFQYRPRTREIGHQLTPRLLWLGWRGLRQRRVDLLLLIGRKLQPVKQRDAKRVNQSSAPSQSGTSC
jgi:hypothetical protein